MARKRYRERVTVNNVTKWATGYSKKELEQNKLELYAKMVNETVIIEKHMLVSDWAKEWKETYKSHIQSSWSDDMDGYIKNVINPNIGFLKLSQIKPIHIQKLFNSISDKSSSYNNKVFLILNQMFKAAIKNKIMSENPLEDMKAPKGAGSRKRRSITEEERKKILEVAEYHRGGLFVKIMLYCGLRPQEVAALQWKDIKDGFIHVTKAVKSNGQIGQPKTSAGVRKVPIPNILLKDLEVASDRQFELICTNSKGGRLTKSSITTLWNSFRREMDIKMGAEVFRNKITHSVIADDLTLYCLRHTYCTDLESAGVSINVARQFMGHESIDVTSRIYTHTSEVAVNEARKLINLSKSVTKVSQKMG